MAAAQRKTSKRRRQQVRIIGGRHRGRQLAFPNVPALRPTPDRIRETVFNWLAGYVEGSRCLDLYAGSGAMGFEAASRGAAHVDLVEKDIAAARSLADNRTLLRLASVAIEHEDAVAFLARPPRPYQGVFLDPPYSVDLEPLLASLREGWLAPSAWVYVERPADECPSLSDLGVVWKERRAGNVRFGLLRPEPLV